MNIDYNLTVTRTIEFAQDASGAITMASLATVSGGIVSSIE